MAITERIGFETADAIANLKALQAAIRSVNSSLRTLNKNAGASNKINNAAAAFRNVSTQAKAAQASVAGAGTAMQNAGTKGTAAGNSLTISWETFGRVVATQLIVRGINAIVQALGDASEAAGKFEVVTARIANITKEGQAGVDGLRDAFIQLSRQTGRSLDEVTAAGLEALQNDLGNTTETMKTLGNEVDNLAKATGTDLTSAVNSVSSVLKAYNFDLSQAADIADTFFVAYDKGRVTMEELESRLGTVIPQSAALGISFQETAASVAALTLSGLNAATAMTQYRNIQAKLIKPTEELQAAFTRLGVATGTELIQKFGGLQGALAALNKAFGGNEQAVAKAFGTIRGQLGVLNLLSNKMTNVTGVSDAMADRFGRVAAAAQAVNQTKFELINRQTQLLNTNLLGIGSEIQTLKLGALVFTNEFILGLRVIGSEISALVTKIQPLIDKFNLLVNPVGATENTRLSSISSQMTELQAKANQTAETIRQSFADERAFSGLQGAQKDLFDRFNQIGEAATVAGATLRAQLLATEARIRSNTEAAEAFKRSVTAATAPGLFDGEQAAAYREQLRGISDELSTIQSRAANADGATLTELQKALDLQRQKIQSKANEVGLDDKGVQALIGQAKAIEQIIKNKQAQPGIEGQIATQANLAAQAFAAQEVAAQGVATALSTDVVGGANNATNAINGIPDPNVNTNAAVAAMKRLEQAALAAARAVAAAGGGGGGANRYTGGVIHRAEGGGVGRGQDTVPAMLSPGEFVMNKRSTGRFFSQLQAMNAGQSPAFRESGGPVTNIGDINVNVSGGSGSENPGQTGRQIASEIRRELRRKTSRLS